MEQWWKRKNVELGNYTKDEVEDFTGCIPLLLEECAVGGKIDMKVETMRTVWNQASAFVRKVRAENFECWDLYVQFSLNLKTSLTSIDIFNSWTLVLDARKCLAAWNISSSIIDISMQWKK